MQIRNLFFHFIYQWQNILVRFWFGSLRPVLVVSFVTCTYRALVWSYSRTRLVVCVSVNASMVSETVAKYDLRF